MSESSTVKMESASSPILGAETAKDVPSPTSADVSRTGSQNLSQDVARGHTCRKNSQIRCCYVNWIKEETKEMTTAQLEATFHSCGSWACLAHHTIPLS